MIRLDYISCVLTIVSTVLIGKKIWHGWLVAALNSVVVCLIGIRTAQFGFVPANLFCIGLYANNLSRWRPKGDRTPPGRMIPSHPPAKALRRFRL
jgi:hypothetical protein